MKLLIERLNHQGSGIGYLEGKIIFVKNALPKELVKIKLIESHKKYNLAKVKKYLKKSPLRKEAFCPFYEKCGGCQLQHLIYEDTLKFKKGKIENILKKENIIKNINPQNYRNKLSLKIANGIYGFYEEKSHELIPIKYCSIAQKSINDFLLQVNKLKIKNGNLTIRSNYNDELLIIIDSKDDIAFNIKDFDHLKIVGVIVNNKCIYGENYFYERIHNCLFKVSYDAFFQINSFITDQMFSIIEENINNSNVVLDLYSGVGTLGIIASKKASKVYSLEIVQNAILDNLVNKRLNHQNNIYPLLGDVPKNLSKIKENFDTIIIDPPRKGLDKNSRELILNSNAQKIIYISCNIHTLARDLKDLTLNYKIEKCYMLDMFSYTYHVESVLLLSLKTTEK